MAVALRGLTDFMTAEEKDDLELDDEELAAIAKPFANIMLKTKINKKYGRAIMDSRDAIEASVMLFFWSGRVGRVKRKYKPRHAKPDSITVERDVIDEQHAGEDVQEAARVLSFANGHRPSGVGFN